MTLEIQGKLLAKYDTLQVNEKFKRREFILQLSEEINGNTYTNYAKMQLVQAKCDLIDRYKEGDMVKVSFNIKGNSYVDKKDGATKYLTNLDAWRVESAGTSTTPTPKQNEGIPVYSSSHTTNGGSGYASPAPSFNPSPETTDGLPF